MRSSTNMKTTGKKQNQNNKFLRRITAPFRALNRIFMNSMFDCAANFDHANAVMNFSIGVPQLNAQLPRNFSVDSSSASARQINTDKEKEELKELIRVMSKKLNGSPTKLKVQIKSASMAAAAAEEMRSYSFGVGKIGRIDEDQPCEFKEFGDGKLGIYPRSRSYAVARRTVVL